MSVDWSQSRVFSALGSLGERRQADAVIESTDYAPPSPPEDSDADEFLDYFQQLAEETRHSQRDALMVQGVQAGMTLQVVGDLFGVSRERVRQIVAAAGVNTRELRSQQKEQADRRRRRVARHVYGVSLTHPELTIEELAEWADTDEATVRQALEHRVAVHEVPYNDWSGGASDDELLDGLRRWAAQETGKYTGDAYSEWATSNGLPGKQIPTMRFGGWNNALRRAGLHDLVRDSGGLRPTISDEALWAGVLQFFRDDVESYSYDGYDEWRRDRALASGATLRARLGSWSDIKARVRQLMRYAAAPDDSWGWAESVLAVNPEEEPRNIVSKDECNAALAEVAERTRGPLTVQLYEASRSPEQPNAGLVQRRSESWIRALHEAGLESRMSVRARNKWAALNAP
ncbi:MAG: hypothetical protein GX596_09095 [Propionibacterium sp.]|nr:hypothetical protein [Propionibacterium sp.]